MPPDTITGTIVTSGTAMWPPGSSVPVLLRKKGEWQMVTEAPPSATSSVAAEPDLLAYDRALAEIVRRLVAAFQPERIYLFGSMARGDAGPDSDYDVLVVVPDDVPPERKHSRLASEALRGTGVAADVLVCTHSYFEARRHLKASLPGTILREGKLLQAA